MAKMYLDNMGREMLCVALQQHARTLTNEHQKLMCTHLQDWVCRASKVTLDVPIEPSEYTADDGTRYTLK